MIGAINSIWGHTKPENSLQKPDNNHKKSLGQALLEKHSTTHIHICQKKWSQRIVTKFASVLKTSK